MHFERQRSQELRNEIHARTLDISGSRIGREMVLAILMIKKEHLHSQKNGTAIPRNWPSCLQKSTSAWNLEAKEWQK